MGRFGRRSIAPARYMAAAKCNSGEKIQNTTGATATTQIERENQRMERSGVARRTWVMWTFPRRFRGASGCRKIAAKSEL